MTPETRQFIVDRIAGQISALANPDNFANKRCSIQRTFVERQIEVVRKLAADAQFDLAQEEWGGFTYEEIFERAYILLAIRESKEALAQEQRSLKLWTARTQGTRRTREAQRRIREALKMPPTPPRKAPVSGPPSDKNLN
jgi:dTDP-D-glucose 4,6-dehydratase